MNTRNPGAGEGLYVPRPDDPPEDSPVETDGYGERCLPVAPSLPSCLAKCSRDTGTGRRRYWLKRAASGAEAGKLYNPHSASFAGPAQKDRHGRPAYEFRPVPEEAFESYLRFLRTGKLVHLRHAERQSL